MGKVIWDKPSIGFVRPDKPTGLTWNQNISNWRYMEDKIIRVGEPMGLLLAITYPETVSFKGERI
jgi:hypothetical protein